MGLTFWPKGIFFVCERLRNFFGSQNRVFCGIVFFVSSNQQYRVRMGPGKPGKSLNFIMGFSRTGKSRKKATGPVKF